MNDELIAEAELGEEARAFKASDLYKVMIGFAQQDALTASEQLSEVDPDDAKAVRALQHKVKLAQSFEEWLNDLIDRGNAAMITFKQQQEN